MSETNVLPEVKEIVGAMLFAAKHPITAAQMRTVFQQVAESHGGATVDFAQLKAALAAAHAGMSVSEVANGYRLENEVACGPWVRELLERGKPNRLSRPALETLAIIAYRQPCVRSEIEAVRGVAVDQILRNLMELQLVRIVGRSDLPGRPMLFGTTQKFLEHFGINTLNDLPGVEELRRMEAAVASGGGERGEGESPANEQDGALVAEEEGGEKPPAGEGEGS